MKIDVTRAFCLAGQPQAVGLTLDVPDVLARELIHNGKATRAQDKPAPAAAPATTPAARPATKKEPKE